MVVKIDGTNGIQNVLGTSSAPADTNTTSTNTGVYYPTSTTWAVATAATNAMYIDASQNVGIKTTSPNLSSSSTALTVNTGTAANYSAIELASGGTLNFYINANNATSYIASAGTRPMAFYTNSAERMRIDNAGNVGIGTTSPLAPLNITGNAPITRYDVSGVGTLSVGFNNSGGTSNNIPTGLSAVWMQQAYPLVFGTNATEAMRIDSSGNVGIGTTTPSAVGKLAVITGTNFPGLYVSDGTYSGAITPSSLGGMALVSNGAYPQIFYVNSAERMRIDSSGNLLVGTTTTLGKSTLFWDNSAQQGFVMKAATTTFNGSPIVFYNSSGSVSGFIGQTASTVTYNTSSDYRLKHDVQFMTGGLNRINALKPVTYKWNVDDSDSEGFIAHELQQVIPLAVTGEKDAVNEDGTIKPQGVDYSKIVVHLVAALQEQQLQIKDLQDKLAKAGL